MTQMTLTELAKRIVLPEEALEAAQMVELSDAEYQTCKELFDRDLGAFLKEWKEKEELGRYTWALRFYLQLSVDTWEQYQAKHIPEEVFDQTFYDLTIWCRECKRKQGIYGLEELWWLAQSVKEHLFRLGRLQFEPIVLKEPLEGNGVRIKAGVKGLNVHIPEGESLAFEKCMDSFRRAEQFFAGRGEGKPEFYMCDSWLLSPALKELLPADSNIIRFQDLFRIVYRDGINFNEFRLCNRTGCSGRTVGNLRDALQKLAADVVVVGANRAEHRGRARHHVSRLPCL